MELCGPGGPSRGDLFCSSCCQPLTFYLTCRELPLPRPWPSQGGLHPMIDNGEGVKVTSAHWETTRMRGWRRCYFSCITMQFFHLLNLASSLSFLLIFWELLFFNKYTACQIPQHLLLENQPETSCPLGLPHRSFLAMSSHYHPGESLWYIVMSESLFSGSQATFSLLCPLVLMEHIH